MTSVSQRENYIALVAFLEANVGKRVNVELGASAHDLDDHDHIFGKLEGTLGELRTHDDQYREGRTFGFVPVGEQERGLAGFFVAEWRLREYKERDPYSARATFDDFYATILATR
jgi:hypothetical protein